MEITSTSIEKILDILPHGITIQDTSGKVLYANKEALRVMGFSSSEKFFQLPPGELMKNFTILDESGNPLPYQKLPGRRALLSGLPEEAILRFKNISENKNNWSWVKAIPFTDSAGVINGVINSFYDLTKFKRSEKTFTLLTNINSSLASILNYESRVKRLAELIVPEMADWCAIDMLTEKGTLVRKAISHIDPKKIKIADILHQKYPSVKNNSNLIQILKNKKPVLFPEITETDIKNAAKDDEHLRLLSQLNIRSIITVPLITRKRALGLITFAYSESDRRYTSDDLEMLELFAHRAATLFDNSRIYEHAKRIIKKQKNTYRVLHTYDKSLRLALEMGKMSTWDWNYSDDVFALSESFKSIYGISSKSKDSTLIKFLDRIYPEDRKAVQKELVKAIKTGSGFEKEFRIALPNGEVKWIYKKGEVIKDKQNNSLRMMGIGMDITERKISEERLKHSEKKFKSVFESSLDPIIITDKNLTIVDLNKAGVDVFKFPRAQLLFSKLSDRLHTNGKKAVAKKLKSHIAHGYGRGEMEMVSHEGNIIPIEYSVKTEVLPNQQLWILRDISKRKVEEKRQEHLLGIASHELTTPLASIKAFVAILNKHLSKVQDSKSQEYLSKIDAKADNLARLIKDLLDMTRIQNNKLDLFYEMFSIDTFLDEQIKELQFTVPSHSIHRTGMVKQDIVADKNRLAQVLINLVQNAIKYSPNSNRININVKIENEEVQISVQDFGVGIPKKDFKKIFDIFYRSNSTEKTTSSGLGVGLYIAAEIVKKSGGKIWVDSELHKGSTFYFTIPLVPKTLN